MTQARRFFLAVLLFGIALPTVVSAQARRGGGSGRRPEVATDAVKRDSSGNVIFQREVFTYPGAQRRDPFASLLASGDIRPLLQDLLVVAITVGQSDRQSVATLKDGSTNDVYRVRVGSVFGRMRVTAIRQREIAVEIDEFGYKRQETLSINVPVGGGRRP